MTENWIDAFASDELADNQAKLVKVDGKRIAVFRTSGELYAIDDRCPHEGYPLVKGAVAECILTCQYHNFKFDLRDGACVMGDEAVRTFPIRLAKDRVEIDIADPPVEVVAARIYLSLEGALLERKVGQAARDVVRLLELGIEPKQLALFVARFDARYAQYGTTHVLPVAEDVIDEAERRGGLDAALPLMQAFEMAAFAHTRRPKRPVVEPTDPGDDVAAAGERLALLVEAEDSAGAEALLRGALRKGWARAEIEPWLYRVVCDHFLDFGHALIYQVKIFDLLDRVGWDHAEELLAAHLYGIVTGTREDTLPEFKHLEEFWTELEPRVADVYASCDSGHAVDVEAMAETFAHGDRIAALQALVDALEAGADLSAVVDALTLGACQRLQRFSLAIDGDPTIQHSWLDVTHVLTFANALRHAVVRYRDPRIVRALLFGARFVNATRVLDEPDVEVAAGEIEDADRFIRDAWEFVLDDPVTRPIVAVHLVKVLVAAQQEADALGDARPLLAAKRVLDSPIRERNVKRVTHEAIRLVRDGKVPRTLY